jgi:hypothetical protein
MVDVLDPAILDRKQAPAVVRSPNVVAQGTSGMPVRLRRRDYFSGAAEPAAS